jgi:hypothetical protein
MWFSSQQGSSSTYSNSSSSSILSSIHHSSSSSSRKTGSSSCGSMQHQSCRLLHSLLCISPWHTCLGQLLARSCGLNCRHLHLLLLLLLVLVLLLLLLAGMLGKIHSKGGRSTSKGRGSKGGVGRHAAAGSLRQLSCELCWLPCPTFRQVQLPVQTQTTTVWPLTASQ